MSASLGRVLQAVIHVELPAKPHHPIVRCVAEAEVEVLIIVQDQFVADTVAAVAVKLQGEKEQINAPILQRMILLTPKSMFPFPAASMKMISDKCLENMEASATLS